MKKKLLSFVLALVVCLGLTATPALAADTVGSFTDVKTTDYFADAVQWAVNGDITTGTSATTFSPDETCTVAQILTFLYRASGSPQVSISNPFTDVSTSDYFYNTALWAYQNDLVSGSTFNPSAPCTRSMVVTYLWKLAGSPVVSESDSGYAPYTISGEGHNGERGSSGPMTITFSAASVKKELIPYSGALHGYPIEDYMAEKTEFEPLPVTLITLQPGSTISFSNDFTEIYMSYGWSTPDYPEFTALFGGTTLDWYFVNSDMDFLPAGEAETAGWGINGRSWKSPHGFQDADGDDYIIVYGGSNQTSKDNSFSDVPSDASYAQAVAWAVENGITTGDSATTFSPDKTCTRGQIVTFLHRSYAD